MSGKSNTRKWRRAGFFVLFAVYLSIALLSVGVGLGGVLAAASPGLHTKLHTMALGTGLLARAALRMADASHTGHAALHVALDFTFSAFNLAFGIVVLWLRPRDRAAHMLALGLVGVAAVFNLQSQAAFEVVASYGWETASRTMFLLVAVASYAYALLVFPDGRLVPYWPKPALAAFYVPLIGGLTWISARAQGQSRLSILLLLFGLVIPLAGVVAQGYRYRKSDSPLEHQQARLLFWALVPSLVVGVTFIALRGFPSLAPDLAGRHVGAVDVTIFRVFQPVLALIPLALFAGMLRYKLWNVDKVISRTIGYGALAAFVTAVYVGIVVGIGQVIGSRGPNIALSVVATGITAIAFQPAKSKLQKLANRLVYGRRATPYEVLSDLCQRMSDSYLPEHMLARTARILAEGTGATGAQVWVRVGSELRLAASWPSTPDSPPPIDVSDDSIGTIDGTTRTSPVRFDLELLGALTVTKPHGESLTLTEDRLMSDLAAQSGLVLRNVRLTSELLERLEELRASRERLVAAQDSERRRLERDLHDGAQQQLVALRVKLELAAEDAPPGTTRDAIETLHAEAGEALETLRDLARGIYPPLLAEQGLAAALRAQARRSTVPVEVIDQGLSRYTQATEAAVYFCCLEALQNVGKYAGASRAAVVLAEQDDRLRFEVRDDGAGFDTDHAKRGSGTQNMSDRVEALGGTLTLESRPGAGTTVRGWVPAAR